jgi:diguanylate cyclase with GGDEF domain
LAVTDEGSGLLHRDSYITCLLSEAERMRTQKTPLSVVLLRFSGGEGKETLKLEVSRKDDLKPETGKPMSGLDVFLQKFASSLMTHLRQNDMAVKYGPHTLALLLPGATGKDAAAVTEKMRRLAVSTAGVPAEEAPRLAAGVAEAIREGAMDSTDRVTELINRLEWALEAASQAGANGVKVLDPPSLDAK